MALASLVVRNGIAQKVLIMINRLAFVIFLSNLVTNPDSPFDRFAGSSSIKSCPMMTRYRDCQLIGKEWCTGRRNFTDTEEGYLPDEI
jgi:hypothetical protein